MKLDAASTRVCPCCGACMLGKPPKQVTCSKSCSNKKFRSGDRNGAYKDGRSKVLSRYKEMISRCHDSTHESFCNYGARGIYVCDRWRFGDWDMDGIGCFIQDMGLPADRKSLDRIDNDGPYSPDNCRWSTPAEQNRNTRRNVYFEIGGQTKTIAEWSEIYGVNKDTVKTRIRRGYDILDALSLSKVSRQTAIHTEFSRN